MRVRRRAYVAIPLALLALAVMAFFLFRGGKALVGGVTHLGDGSTPEFAFKLEKTLPLSVNEGSKSEPSVAAEDVATAVVPVMNELYREAFLNPGDWKHNSYDSVWALFDESAAAQAQTDVDVLTAGTAAGDSYDSVIPDSGRLTIKVLLDKKDQPATAVAIVTFKAEAAGVDGQNTLMNSSGQYFLREIDGGWLVYSYKVVRDDEIVPPSATPTGTESS